MTLYPYEIPLKNGQDRRGAFLNISDEQGNSAWGEIAPIPGRSFETLPEALGSLNQKKNEIIEIDWTPQNCFKEMTGLNLFPSAIFGLESAILSLLSPRSTFQVNSSAFFMGSPSEILEQAESFQGFPTAKVKVGDLTFEEAFYVIDRLKNTFKLRVDVNRAWTTQDSLRFFSQFPLETFDYVEEPFQNPHDLGVFTHPLAVDESFPYDLAPEQLEALPMLKALIYKPTIQGGMTQCLSLYTWASQRGIDLVLGSSFESDLGLAHIARIARLLGTEVPAGIGTSGIFKETVCKDPLRYFSGTVTVPAIQAPKDKFFFNP